MRFHLPASSFFAYRFRPAALRLIALALLSLAAVWASADDWGPDASPSDPVRAAGPPARALSEAASPVRSPPPSRKILALKEKANQLYRAKRYQDAGRIYRDIAELDTLDASARNNLGLCFLKRGLKDSALEASRDALRLADASLARDDTGAWSFPDLRARKTAYFNLDKLGGPMPAPKAGQCETWSAFSRCRARLHVCAETGSGPVRGGTLHWDILRAGLTRAKALFSYDEVEVASLIPHPEMRDMEELSIEGVPESKSRWVNRDSSVVLPLGEFLEVADSACAKDCGNLEKVRTECRVIHFDPCAGVVGVACAIQEADGDDKIVIGEFYLIPAE